MKQTIRKILAALLIFSIVFSIGVIAIGTSAVGSILFSDDFSATTSLTDRGWHNNNSTVVDGALRVSNTRLTLSTFDGALSWKDYSLEADVRMEPLEGITANDIVASINVRNNSNSGKGYEFGVCYKRTDVTNTYVRLYQRLQSGTATTFAKNPVTNNKVSFVYNETQHLRIDVVGDSITCYMNDDPTPVLSVTDSLYDAGTISLRALNCIAWFDNIVVKGLAADESSSEQQSSSEEQTSSDVTTSASSNTSSDAVDVYFAEDFSAANTAGRGWNKTWDTPNGNVVIAGTNNYLIGNTAYKAWTDYAVEADVSIDLNTATASMNHATLVGRATSGSTGYEFRLVTKNNGTQTIAQLYEQGTGNIAVANIKNFDYTATHKMKMVFNGNVISCFIDGELVIKTSSDKYSAGSIAIKGAGYAATFDNIVVRKATEAEINADFPQDTSSEVSSSTSSTTTSSTTTSSTVDTSSNNVSSDTSDIYFTDDFSATNTSGRGWNKTVETPNGNIVIAGNNNYLTGNATYKAWTDYTVEADVFIDLNTATASMNHATLVGRAINGTTGYEFRLITKNNGAQTIAQLYEQGASNIATADIKNFDYTATHKMKMVFNGNSISCFIDGELVLKASSDKYSAGSIAIKGAGYAATFDNIVVRKSTAAEINATLPQDTSSNTSSSSGNTSNSGDIYFSDDFSTPNTGGRGWNKTVETPNGYLSFENSGTTNVYLATKAEHKALTNYAAEVDIRIDRKIIVPDTKNNYAYLVVRTTGGTSGYLFRFMTASDGSKFVDLYDYGTKQTLATNKTYKLSYGITYRFKAVVQDDLILCFINDELVMRANATTFANGAVALRNEGNAARFDNLVVRKSTPEEINATFKQPVAPKADVNGVYFTDSFDTRKQSASVSNVWNEYFKNVDNGQAVLSELYQANNYLVGDGGFYMLSDYTVQGQVILPSVDMSSDISTAGILGRVNGDSGYAFYLSSADDGTQSSAVLYDRSTKKAILTNSDIKIERDASYTLSMVFAGSTVRCYVDGAMVIELQDAAYQTGTAGLISSGSDGYFDEFIVRKSTSDELNGVSVSVKIPGTGDQTLWIVIGVCVLALLCGAYVCITLLKKKKN